MNFLGVEVQAHKLPVSVVDDVWLTGQTLPLKGFCWVDWYISNMSCLRL